MVSAAVPGCEDTFPGWEILVLLSVLLPSDCPGATRLTLEVTRLCSFGVIEACGDSRLTFPFPVLLLSVALLLPGACVLTAALPDTPGPWLESSVMFFLPPGPSFETLPDELPDELADELPPGPEELPEEELPPVPVESVVPERKEPATIPVSPSFVWRFPSYSWDRNWNT